MKFRIKFQKKSQGNFEQLGKYIIWFLITVLLSGALYFLIKKLTSGEI